MGFSSGYWRDVRVSREVSWPIWVRRARCRRCGTRPALLPSFCSVYRRYAVAVMGSAVEAHVAGVSLRAVAARAGLNEPAVRLWCRRFRDRAEVTAAVVAGLGGLVGVTAGLAEAAVLSALQAAVAPVCETQEGLERWSMISAWTGGMWLAPLEWAKAPASRVFHPAGEERLMSLIDANEPKRPP
jgi:hypothetical protein